MKVNEIFESVQGEGQLAGYPCVFVRLFGCNFNCNWCDTPYAKAPSKDFKEMSVAEVVDEVEKYDPDYVCITGGEPLLQKEKVRKLINKLNCFCEVNTNGSFRVWEDNDLRWAIDFKMPSSGMYGRFQVG